jgi:glycosyltransferase involved in cell wall biosynthesis
LLVALWLKHWGERRVVVSVHCYGRHRWFYRWAAERFGGSLFWLSPAMKNYYGAGPRTWENCVPGCVPVAKPVATRERGTGPIRLGGVGALVRWKKWDLVVDAWARLSNETKARVTFSHIGGTDGSADSQNYADELRAMTDRAGFADRIAWRGAQPSADELLANIDCLIVASANEPFSVAMLEALQAGVPVLAADSGGAVDVIVVGKNGWLFRSGDAADLARSIAGLVETDLLAQTHLVTDSVQPFTAPVVAAQWAEIYSRLGSAE